MTHTHTHLHPPNHKHTHTHIPSLFSHFSLSKSELGSITVLECSTPTSLQVPGRVSCNQLFLYVKSNLLPLMTDLDIYLKWWGKQCICQILFPSTFHLSFLIMLSGSWSLWTQAHSEMTCFLSLWHNYIDKSLSLTHTQMYKLQFLPYLHISKS